jgi:hypothetical protein
MDGAILIMVGVGHITGMVGHTTATGVGVGAIPTTAMAGVTVADAATTQVHTTITAMTITHTTMDRGTAEEQTPMVPEDHMPGIPRPLVKSTRMHSQYRPGCLRAEVEDHPLVSRADAKQQMLLLPEGPIWIRGLHRLQAVKMLPARSL